MPRLEAVVTYRNLPDGEPDFTFIEKATVYGLRENSKIDIVPHFNGLRLTTYSATGMAPIGITVTLGGARSLRDYMIRLCDQLGDERPPR